MTKHFAFATLLSILFLFGFSGTIAAQQPAGGSDDKIKVKVQKRMENGKRKVVVEMANGIKIKGNITAADAGSFTLAMLGSNQTSVIPYREVAKLKGTGWPTSSKIAIGVGAASAATLIILYAAFQHATRNN